MLILPLVLLASQSPAFQSTGGVAVSCLENLRGKVGRARVEIVVGAGALQEKETARGVAHLLEHLLLRPLDFDDSNGTTGWDYTSYYRNVSGGELGAAASQLLRAVGSADFSDRAFALEKKIVLRELEDRGASTEGLDPLFGETILGRHPGGSATGVQSLTVEDAKRFHHRYYTKGNIALLLRGAVDCEKIRANLESDLAAIPEGDAADRRVVGEAEPGPRSLPGGPGEFLQGFYWYDASPKEEIVWRLIAQHLEHGALDELRKKRGLTYSPHAVFDRRGSGGRVALVVKTGGESSEVADWYERAVASLRADGSPRQTMEGAIREVRKDLEGDNVRSGLAAIRGEPQPIEILDNLSDDDLQGLLPELLAPRRSFGTATPESNIASLIVLGLFGLIVLGVLGIVAKKMF